MVTTKYLQTDTTQKAMKEEKIKIQCKRKQARREKETERTKRIDQEDGWFKPDSINNLIIWKSSNQSCWKADCQIGYKNNIGYKTTEEFFLNLEGHTGF